MIIHCICKNIDVHRKFVLTRECSSTIWLVNAVSDWLNAVTCQNKFTTPPHQYGRLIYILTILCDYLLYVITYYMLYSISVFTTRNKQRRGWKGPTDLFWIWKKLTWESKVSKQKFPLHFHGLSLMWIDIFIAKLAVRVYMNYQCSRATM